MQYTARRVDDNTYTVLSKGLVNGQPHAIQATVTRSYLYPFAIFAKTSITFNGNTGDYDPGDGTGPVETVDPSGNPGPEPGARRREQRPDHVPRFRLAGAPPGLLQRRRHELRQRLSAPRQLQPAESDAHVPGAREHSDDAVPAGVAQRVPGGERCAARRRSRPASTTAARPTSPGQTLSFPSTFSIGAGLANGGVVEIYVIPTDNSNITVSIADATVNLNGDPTKLRVYLAGGTIDPGNGAHSGDFTGILYAPSAQEANPSCKANWRGALVVNTFTCNGGPHLQVHYDTRMQSLTQSTWTRHQLHRDPVEPGDAAVAVTRCAPATVPSCHAGRVTARYPEILIV